MTTPLPLSVGFTPYFTVTGISSPVTAGTQDTITVTAYNSDNTVNTGYTGTVHITSSDGQAVLGGDATLTDGVGTFNVTLKTAGTQSVTATDTVTSTDTGSETEINVVPAATSQLACHRRRERGLRHHRDRHRHRRGIPMGT